MKKIKIQKKLSLNKKTITPLNIAAQENVKGGAKIPSIQIACITLLTVNGCASGNPCSITNVARCEDTFA